MTSTVTANRRGNFHAENLKEKPITLFLKIIRK